MTQTERRLLRSIITHAAEPVAPKAELLDSPDYIRGWVESRDRIRDMLEMAFLSSPKFRRIATAQWGTDVAQ